MLFRSCSIPDLALPSQSISVGCKNLYLILSVFFVPWTLLAALLAFTLFKDVPVKANVRQQLDIFSNPDTWIMTLMYVMTFGVFSGFSAQFALIINTSYGKDNAHIGGNAEIVRDEDDGRAVLAADFHQFLDHLRLRLEY